jgi:hypothetical protein
MTPPALSTVLPRDAALRLQQAAMTDSPATDPLRRQKAIEKATKQIQQQYPRFFSKEQQA